MPSRPVAILDACVLINLLASGRAHDILAESRYQFGICSVVKNESIYLRAMDLNAPPEEVKLDLYLESNSLVVYELSGDGERELYIDFAAELDDGEAMSLALVHARGFAMASDDRKARRIFIGEVADPKRLLSTSQILKEWSEIVGLNPAGLKQVLFEVSRRGRFFPNSGDDYFEWWSKAMV
jgi:hypothetical protein